MLILLLAVQCFWWVACKDGGASSEAILAEAYYRYDPSSRTYTPELTLSRMILADSNLTAYAPKGGVAFLGSNLENDLSEPTYHRYRQEVYASFNPQASFQFSSLSAKPIRLTATLEPMDSLTISGHVTHNFGLSVYSLDKTDLLGSNEKLAAVYESNNGEAKLAEISGPTTSPGIFQFDRTSVAAWPMGQGKVTFIRTRVTPIEQDGVIGTFTEEVYSRTQATGVFN